jgi:hypothetical protein
MEPQNAATPRWSMGRTILLAGFAAGLADYLYATLRTVFNGGSAWQPWQGVAYGLIGEAAKDGGAAVGLLGIGLHFFIMFGAATLFYLLVKRLRWFASRPWISGVLLGIGFLVIMNWVILPLSQIGHPIYKGGVGLTRATIVHILVAGMPIAWLTSLGLRSIRKISA